MWYVLQESKTNLSIIFLRQAYKFHILKKTQEQENWLHGYGRSHEMCQISMGKGDTGEGLFTYKKSLQDLLSWYS